MLRRLLVYAGFGVAALAAMGVLAGIFYVYTITRDLPSVEALQNYSPPVTTRVYAGNGTVIGEYARESRIFVPAAFCLPARGGGGRIFDPECTSGAGAFEPFK